MIRLIPRGKDSQKRHANLVESETIELNIVSFTGASITEKKGNSFQSSLSAFIGDHRSRGSISGTDSIQLGYSIQQLDNSLHRKHIERRKLPDFDQGRSQ